ncbi:MAG: hypothetical protein RMJ56_08830 [Gemmataceae bacterium]|nr:hypothetical protein [Gemmata sp.]MDW8197690.1 hypothetical protein [Gemmataceae bacterium]
MQDSRRSIVWLAAPVTLGLIVALGGCSRVGSVGGSNNSRAEKARSEAEQLAITVVVAGAAAQAHQLPDGGKAIAQRNTTARAKVSAPKSTPRPGSPALIREHVISSRPYLSEAEAEEDTFLQAQTLLAQKFAELDPPLDHTPSMAEVKAEYLRKETRTVSPPSEAILDEAAQAGLAGKLVYVGYDVEVSADQVRELRSQQRVMASLRIVGILMASALAIFLFLRADDWTKGYLTRWLALAAVIIAGGTAAALIFI